MEVGKISLRESQETMELFSGSSKALHWRHKKEVEPFFAPQRNQRYIFGMPSKTEYLVGKFEPARERRNEPLM